MKKLSSIIFSFFYCCISGTVQASEADRLFYEAVRAEASGNFKEAIIAYKRIEENKHSANLHGNLANSLLEIEHTGQAILHYRKALLLDPDNREFKENLEYAKKIAGISSEIPKKSWYIGPEKIDFWSLVRSLVFWISAIFIAYLYYLGWEKRKLIVPFIICATITSTCEIAHRMSTSLHEEIKKELIIVNPLFSDQNKSSKIALRRFAGLGSSENTFVQPGESVWLTVKNSNDINMHQSIEGKKWILVRTLDDRKKGWIERESVELIYPGKFSLN